VATGKSPAADRIRTVVDHAMDRIRRSIFEGRYTAGQRLIETELTQILGISRGPIREALRRLAETGLVEIEPYRGAMVTRTSRAELEDKLALKEVLEGLAARLAAERIDLGRNRRLAEREMDLLRRDRVTFDPARYLDENDRFHQLIIDLSGNSALGRQIRQLEWPALRTAFFRVFGPDLQAESLAKHRDVLGAILDGKAAVAERAMRAHVRRSIEICRRLPDSLFRG
jgi:DNA-binding GntR family transcriptional regulator